jgi:glutathione S-transferase
VENIELTDIKLNYVGIEQARAMSGLRLILGAYAVPGPWRESCKGLFYVKGLEYVPTHTANLGREDYEFGVDKSATVLEEWTGQPSAPVALWNNERPRASWVDQVYLAERLNPEPPLIPDNLADRVKMIGLIHLICGEEGVGWNVRHIIVKNALTELPPDDPWYARLKYIGEKYRYSPEAGEAAPPRIAEIFDLLNAELENQRDAGKRYFIGDRLSALDIYWACFAGAMQPLPQALCPMATDYRPAYTNADPIIAKALTRALIEHRDYIYENYLELPIVF